MRRASLFTIFLIVFIDLIGFGIVLPNLQLYGRHFGIENYFVLTVFGAIYSLFQFAFAPILGRWSDRVGRRPVLLLSQAGTLVGFLMLFAAHFFTGPQAGIGIALIFLSRVIDGISGGNISTANAYIADITKPEERAKGMGLIGAAFGLGFVFGPLIGGLIGGSPSLGLAYVPLAASLFSVLALLMTWFTLPESLNPDTRPQDLRRFSITGFRRTMQRPILAPMILMFFVHGFAFAGMEQTFSLLIQKRLFDIPPRVENATPTQQAEHDAVVKRQTERASRSTGYLFFGIGILIALIQGGMIHRLTKKFGEAALVIVGPTLVAVGFVVLAMPVHWQWPWTGFALGSVFMALGSGIFNPSLQALISRHTGAHEQGEVLGVNQGMASLARGVGPILAGALFYLINPETPYYVAAGLCVCVTAAAWAMRATLKPPAA